MRWKYTQNWAIQFHHFIKSLEGSYAKSLANGRNLQNCDYFNIIDVYT